MPITVPRTKGSLTIRHLLVTVDLIAIVVGWSISHAAVRLPSEGVLEYTVTLTVALLANGFLLKAHGLYRTRTCSLVSREVVGLARSCLGTGVAVLALSELLNGDIRLTAVALGAALTFTLLTVGRTTFSMWLRAQRAAGRFVRRVLLVGDNAEAAALEALIRDQPALGYQVCGHVGEGHAAAVAAPWLGLVGQAVGASVAVGATGALIATSALSSGSLNTVVRELLDAGIHVRLSCGLQGVTQRRLVAAPLAREPLFYVEEPRVQGWPQVIKRAVDVVVATMMLTMAAPVLAVAAIAIKLDSPGPVIFTQQRAGREGLPFRMYKLRTMTANAETLQSIHSGHSVRTGPLFKLFRDPRITRVGRVLRVTSIDEIPQLWNVLCGNMSLVGPRPLPIDEAAAVHQHLPDRTTTLPGMTGLWQIEARDNPAFEPLQRLDAFYIENRSPQLDLQILVRTVGHVSARSFRALRPRRNSAGSSAPILD